MSEEGNERDFPDEKPMDEFEWEKFLKESDARTDKYMALFEKYKDHPDCEKLIAKEMGWEELERRLEEYEKEHPHESEAVEIDPSELDDLSELVPNPLTEGVDWIRDERGNVKHPLQQKMFELALDMWHHCNDRKLLGESGDPDLHEMLFQAQTTGAKLAGALNSLAYREEPDGGFIVAYLKRALSYLNHSLAAWRKVDQKKLVEADKMQWFRNGLFEVREGILALMKRFRGSP